LRQTAGWAGYTFSKNRAAQAREDRDSAAEARMKQQAALNRGDSLYAKRYGATAKKLETAAARKMTQASYGSMLADSKFNLMNTAGAKAAMKAVGVTGFAAGESSKGTEGYAGRIKKDAEAAEKRIRGIAVSGDDEKKTADRIREQRREVRDTKAREKENTKKIQDAIRDAAESERNGLKSALAETATKQSESTEKYEKDLKAFAAQAAAGTSAPGALEALKTKRELEIQAEGAKIKETEVALQQLDKKKYTVEVDGARHENSVEGLEPVIKALDKEIKAHERDSKETKDLIKVTTSAMKESAQNVAETSGKNYYSPLTRTPAQRKYIGKEVRNKFKTNTGSASLKQTLEELAKEENEPAEAAVGPEGGAEKH
jgi:chromosome segregation ATPase